LCSFVAKKSYFMKTIKSYFTLLELVVSMGVFVVLLLSSTIIFNSAQKTWALADEKIQTSNNARLALDVIAKDIETSICFYEFSGNRIKVPWWHKPKYFSSNAVSPSLYRNELINMVSMNNRPRSSSYTNLCEIKIQLRYKNKLSNKNTGKLYRNYTDIKNGALYNWGIVHASNTITGPVDESVNPPYNEKGNYTVGLIGGNNAFTSNNDSSKYNQLLISHVYELKFYCYDENGNLIENYDAGGVALPDALTAPTEYPFSVDIELTLLPEEAWNKWVVLAGTLNGESADAAAFRRRYQQTYTKTVFLGNRGQYEHN